jgi:hypothetical protein
MRGVLHLLVTFTTVIMITLVFFFMGNPMLLNFLSGLSESGQDLILMANESLNDTTTGQELVASMDRANDGIVNSTTVISYAIQYSWLVFLIVIGAIFFLLTRETSEQGTQRLI